ncbi:transglutaminase-like domain-containing protein [Ramlibacter tataouinensis]|uniref:transglutaminase-like domain-containing protein n=1 Tax=Ramlibacter tataouinensis TaxID=94132 RepID=UPI000776D236|nr:transglutaminase-like domain-containing protein [Ramlibacter tataouinensis]
MTTDESADNRQGRTAEDDPDHWLGPTELLDLGDAKVRLRARSLTQLAKSEREKALALYGYVKRLPFTRQFKLSLRGPRKVLEAGCGDALDKVGLLLALLRIVDIPARIRHMALPGEMLRGLLTRTAPTARPVVEIWLGGQWLATDTYIFDAAYMAAARHRLRELDWECGYGIHREGASIWGGLGNAFLVGDAIAAEHLKPVSGGVFEDPAAFVASPEFRQTHPALYSNLKVLALRKVIRNLRDEAVSGAPKTYGRTS